LKVRVEIAGQSGATSATIIAAACAGSSTHTTATESFGFIVLQTTF